MAFLQGCLPLRFARIAFALIMAFVMSGMMSAFVTTLNLGMIEGWLWAWLHAWKFAFLIAFPAIILLSPIVHRLVNYLSVRPGP